MHWNNRILKHSSPHGECYRIHEVYYDMEPDGNEDGLSWTVEPKTPFGETVDELIEDLEMMLRDAEKSRDDIIEYDSKRQ